jgi:hypothetical protein
MQLALQAAESLLSEAIKTFCPLEKSLQLFSKKTSIYLHHYLL